MITARTFAKRIEEARKAVENLPSANIAEFVRINKEIGTIMKTLPPIKPKRFQRTMRDFRYLIKGLFGWKKDGTK